MPEKNFFGHVSQENSLSIVFNVHVVFHSKEKSFYVYMYFTLCFTPLDLERGKNSFNEKNYRSNIHMQTLDRYKLQVTNYQLKSIVIH